MTGEHEQKRGTSAADVTELLLTAGFFYLALRPDALTDLEDRVGRWRELIAHRLSVWQQRREIQSLPEIERDP